MKVHICDPFLKIESGSQKVLRDTLKCVGFGILISRLILKHLSSCFYGISFLFVEE